MFHMLCSRYKLHVSISRDIIHARNREKIDKSCKEIFMIPLYEEHAGLITVYKQKAGHFSPHLHHSLELVYLVSGEIAIGVRQNLYPMETGDLAVIFPDMIHHCQVFGGKKSEVCHIIAPVSLVEAYRGELTNLKPAEPVIGGKDLHHDVPKLVESLLLEYGDQTDEAYPKEKEVLAHAYMEMLLARCMPLLRLTEKGAEATDIIYRTVSYVSAHFREPVSLTAMAADLGISPFALSRVFSGTFHRNFNRYLNETRLDYACTMLRHTDRSVTDIAYESGFESQRTFNRAFTEVYHMTPREYRKMAPGAQIVSDNQT